MDEIKEKIERLEEDFGARHINIRSEIRERTVSYIVASLGLVASLAWNDAIKSTIEYYLPLSNDTLRVKFLYAIVITIAIGAITVFLIRLLEKKGRKK